MYTGPISLSQHLNRQAERQRCFCQHLSGAGIFHQGTLVSDNRDLYSQVKGDRAGRTVHPSGSYSNHTSHFCRFLQRPSCPGRNLQVIIQKSIIQVCCYESESPHNSRNLRYVICTSFYRLPLSVSLSAVVIINNGAA